MTATSSGPTLLGKLRALEVRFADGDPFVEIMAQGDLADLLPQIIGELSQKPENSDTSSACVVIGNIGATLEIMEQQGGSFVRSLADCYLHADSTNRPRLLAAFPDWFGKYSQRAIDAAKERT